jgi:hypothetical protein
MPRVALFLLAGLFVFASPARADDVKAAIDAANAKMEADYAAGDSKAIAAAYTEDGVWRIKVDTWNDAPAPTTD